MSDEDRANALKALYHILACMDLSTRLYYRESHREKLQEKLSEEYNYWIRLLWRDY